MPSYDGTCLALVDVDAMYASCERIFQPELHGRPVVVLSNNDGCVVARSAEVKALGVPMGEPWFKLRDLAKKHGIVARSSNYALYADMSNRMVSILREFTPRCETYSIDESFIDLGCVRRQRESLVELGQAIRERMRRDIGLPVCVGIGGRTKTLAKIANRIAKKRPEFGGVCDLDGVSSFSVQ